MELRARIAGASDLTDLVRLCKRSVGDDDYVIPRLETVVKKRGLFVVFSREKIIAMSNFSRAIDGSAWLGMARTDPDFRGQGVAQFMQRKIGAYAKKRGIRVMRFWILSSNKSSIRAAEKGRFIPVADAMRIETHLPLQLQKQGKFEFRSTYERNLGHQNQNSSTIDLSNSIYLKKMNGFFCFRNCFAKMSAGVLRELKDDLYWQGDICFLLSQPAQEFENQSFSEFSPLFGPPQRLFPDVVNSAKSLGIRELGGFIPFDLSLARVSRKFGFALTDWGRHAIIFEKRVT